LTTFKPEQQSQTKGPVIARIVDRTSTTFLMYMAEHPLEFGLFVTIPYDDKGDLLGYVEQTYISSQALTAKYAHNFSSATERSEFVSKNPFDKSYHGFIRIVGYIDSLIKSRRDRPSVPVLPGTEVYATPDNILKLIFGPVGDQYIRIGLLLRNQAVPVHINVEALPQHIAVLGKTRSGKSNLNSEIIKQLAIKAATVLVFDYHGEYAALNIEKSRVKEIKARFSPYKMRHSELAKFWGFPGNASIQRNTILYPALKTVNKRKLEIMNASDPEEEYYRSLNNAMFQAGQQKVGDSKNKNRSEQAGEAINRVEAGRRILGNLIDPGFNCNLFEEIQDKKINILDLYNLESPQREKVADHVMSYLLEEIIRDRSKAERDRQKQGWTEAHLKTGIMVLIEEAYLFIRDDSEKNPLHTKDKAATIAREGAKFGVGLWITSQRPRGIDANVLSQMSSQAILHIEHNEDIEAVKSAFDNIPANLVEQLSSLSQYGEAILSGDWVNTPTFVSVKHVTERKLGTRFSLLNSWQNPIPERSQQQHEDTTIKGRERSDSYFDKDMQKKYLDDDDDYEYDNVEGYENR